MRKFALLLPVLLLTACHGQVKPNPTTHACPATTATNYVPLNQSAPATVLAYTDTQPAAGVYVIR